MATLEASIYAYLSGVAGVTNLTSTRIFASVIPDDQIAKLPAIAYSRESEEEFKQFSADASTTKAQITFEINAATSPSRGAVTLALRTALDRFAGVMGGGVTVLTCRYIGERDDYDDNPVRFIREVEFEFIYSI